MANTTQEANINASKAIRDALKDMPYAIVGGTACQLLGSTRVTEDVDFVVLEGKTREARAALKKSELFHIDPRTLHTTYQGVQIDILAPPGMFKEAFDEHTPVQLIDGIKVLQTAQLLNAKCGSVRTRADRRKEQTDAFDIVFLLGYFAARGGATAEEKEQVPNATEEFQCWFSVIHGEAPWEAARLLQAVSSPRLTLY